MNQLTLNGLTQIIGGGIIAIAVIELNIIRMYSPHSEITICCVVATRLTVFRISQPPRTAVRRMPRALLTDSALHCITLAAAATFLTAGHIHEQLGFSGIVCEILAQSVVHEGPVVLVAR